MKNNIYCKICTYPLIDDKCQNPTCEECSNKLLKRQYKMGKYMAELDEIKEFLEEIYQELNTIIRIRNT